MGKREGEKRGRRGKGMNRKREKTNSNNADTSLSKDIYFM